jgi:hypothetical protein
LNLAVFHKGAFIGETTAPVPSMSSGALDGGKESANKSSLRLTGSMRFDSVIQLKRNLGGRVISWVNAMEIRPCKKACGLRLRDGLLLT